MMHRREFNALFGWTSLSVLSNLTSPTEDRELQKDRCLGLLLGGLIGDAIGGPMEFAESPPEQLCNARAWPDDRRINDEVLNELAQTLPFLDYETIRPEPAPYGHWKANAPAGTLTDDSRHKIVLMDAIKKAVVQKRQLSSQDLAQAYLAFRPVGMATDKSLRRLNEEGFQEYRLAANWILGERNSGIALPPERLWSGVDTCAGQMLLPPLAVAYAGHPVQAYKKAFEIDFVDAPGARDLASATVAGLASVLSKDLDKTTSNQRWDHLFEAMVATDPFRYSKVPYVGRPLLKWLKLSDEISRQAEGSPKELFKLLESKGNPKFYWDAHFTLLVPICILKFCQFHPMAAMHLTLDFGHDTDSYAQVLGCMIGAVHGTSVFSKNLKAAVRSTLKTDYGHDVNDWLKLLFELGR